MIKKNLIFFMSNFSSGGAGNSISKLCLNLSQKEYKITIISLGKCAYSKIFKRNNIDVHELKNRKLFFSIKDIKNTIEKCFQDSCKNILISNIHYNNIILTLIARRINGLRIILVERTPLEELDIFFSIKDFLKKKIIKFLIKFIYPLSDTIVANSSGIKKGFPKNLKKNVKVIYPPSITKILKRKKLRKISKKKLEMVCFSRLTIEKNIECAINSLNYLKNENVSLTIYGNGNLKEKLISLSKKFDLSDKILFKNHTNNVLKDIKKFDILISPSFFEGCSNSIIEALNNDLIVIASNCPGGNCEILANGRFGQLFLTNNSYDLSLKIKKILRNFDHFKYKYRKQKIKLSNFLLSKNVKEYSKLFEKV